MKGNEQNGCQPSASQDLRSSAPATVSRTRSASLTTHDQYSNICRDFIWGICTKGPRCAYRHERDMECMKTILKFCHNFQNKTGCKRADCTYLHASREEQSLFLNSGQIPKVLADRYAAMSTCPSTSGTVNNIHSHGGESHSLHGPQAAYPGSPRAFRAVMPSLLMPPPPPPPLVTVPVTTTSVQPGPSTFPAPVQRNVSPVIQIKQQITSLPPTFDVTKPPPPLPQPAQISRKRSAPSIEAGPCKARKLESTDIIDNLCDNCVQRQIRVELLRQDLHNFQTDKDYKADLYTKKCEDYEHGKLLMRSIVNADLYHFLEDYIEDSSSGTHTQEQSQFAQISSLATGTSSSSKPFMRQLLERVFDNGTRNLLEAPSMPVNNLDNPILKTLTSFARTRSAPVKKGTAEVFQTLLDLMCDRNVPDDANEVTESRTNNILSLESLSSSSSFSSVMSGFTQFINNQRVKSPSPEVQSSTLPQSVVAPSTSYAAPVVAVPNTLISSPPPNFVRFQPNIPPPKTRPMFPPPMGGSIPGSIPNTNPYNPGVRMCATPTMTTRSAVGGASPPQQTGQNVVRFPGTFPMPPHYYPPFQ